MTLFFEGGGLRNQTAALKEVDMPQDQSSNKTRGHDHCGRVGGTEKKKDQPFLKTPYAVAMTS